MELIEKQISYDEFVRLYDQIKGLIKTEIPRREEFSSEEDFIEAYERAMDPPIPKYIDLMEEEITTRYSYWCEIAN